MIQSDIQCCNIVKMCWNSIEITWVMSSASACMVKNIGVNHDNIDNILKQGRGRQMYLFH